MTIEAVFCDRCQRIVGVDCECLYSLSSSSEKSKETVNGDSGDNGVSPFAARLTSTDLPAGTAGTHLASESPRRTEQDKIGVPKNGDNDLGVSPIGNETITARPQVIHSPRSTSWTASGLLSETFSEPRWAVPGLIPEGVTMLAGAPKAGKSWMALGLSVSVASGGKALGAIKVQAGPALYLALEDNARRLQRRLRQVLAGAEPPDDLLLSIECPPLPSGGLDKLERTLNWYEGHDRPARLVMVDVFEKVRGPAPLNMSAYQADYHAVGMVKQLADAYGVAIVLLHHVRKVSSTDWLSEISGTLGLPGACDTILILKRSRGEADGLLQITGRDVEEEEYALRFDPKLGAWQMLGLAAELDVSDTRRKILGCVRDSPGMKPAAVAMATGLDRELVKKTMARMHDDGQLQRDQIGRYYLPAPLIETEEEPQV